MARTILYLNQHRQIKEVEGVVNGENVEFQFNELNFVIAVLNDGKRESHGALKIQEQYHCSGFGHQYEVDTNDFSVDGRLLVLSTNLFFLSKGGSESESTFVYPSPHLRVLVPNSRLPNTTDDFVLHGSFFTEDMTVSIEGQTVNYLTFISDNEVRVNVTMGVTEGSYDVTLNNGGDDVIFKNALLVVLGTVFEPKIADWSSITGNINIYKDAEVETAVWDSLGTAVWSLPFDYTKDFAIRVRPTGTPLGDEDDGNRKKVFELKQISNDLTVFAFSKRESGNVPAISARMEGYTIEDGAKGSVSGGSALTAAEAWNQFETYAEVRWIGGALFMYDIDNTLIWSYTTVFTENLYLKVTVGNVNLVDIKYIELAT